MKTSRRGLFCNLTEKQCSLKIRLAVKLLVFICFFGVLNSRAALVGPNISSKGINLTGVGTVQWSNAIRLKANDNSYAKVSLNPSGVSNYLVGRGFGFALPSNAVISGIQVTIGYYSSTGTPRIQDNEVRLVKAGAVTGNNKAITNTDWPTSETTQSYGGSSDSWGVTWTASDINSNNFGVALSVKNAGSVVNTAYVDYVQVTISYGVPEPTIQASNVVFSGVSGSGMNVSWTRGNGSYCIVLMKQANVVDSDPVDLTNYKDNTTFGNGDQIGTGNFVVYIGTGNSVAVKGLSSSTTYAVAVYEFNGSKNDIDYLEANPARNFQKTTALKDDYRSASTGLWSNAATWQRYQGGWGAASVPPTSTNAGKITIQSGHTVTVSADVTASEVQIDAGGQIAVSSGKIWTIAQSSVIDLTVDGTIVNSGAITLSNGVAAAFYSGSLYDHAQNDGSIPVATWDINSTCRVTGTISTVPGNLNQAFGNFIWNNTSQTNALELAGNLKTVKGNFSMQNTGTGSLSLGSATGDLTIGGDFTQSGGTLIGTQSTINRVINVAGGFTLSNGTLDLNSGSGLDSLKVNGNFSHTGGILTVTGASTGSGVFFNGTTNQLYTSGGAITNKVNFTVLSGDTLQMGTGAAPSVISGGTGSFLLLTGATLGITSTDGISVSGSTGNIQVGGTRAYSIGVNYIYNGTSQQVTGNGLSQNTTGDVTINNAVGVNLSAPVILGGSLFIKTGAKFGQGVNLITLYGDFVNAGTLINDNGGLTLTGDADQSIDAFTTSGALSMTKTGGIATFLGNCNAGALILNGNGSTLHLGYGLNHTLTGDLTRTQGGLDGGSSTLNIGGSVTGTGGTFTANAGKINYSGSGNQTVASLSYNHLGVSGSGIKAISSSLTLGGDLSIASGPSLVVRPKKALTVNNGTISNSGTFILSSDTSGTATLIDKGIITGGGVFSVHQYLSVAGRNYYMASPVSGANGSVVSGMYYYDEPTNSWKNVANTDPLNPLIGYIVNKSSADSINFTGGLFNTANQSIVLKRTAGAVKAGYNLIGNPYPSYVDLKAAMQTELNAGNLEPTIWYRTKSIISPYPYVFETVNTTSGVGTSISIPGRSVTQYLPPMQSAWVRVVSGKTSATIGFTNAMRSHSDPLVSANRLRSAVADDNRVLRLRVSNGSNDDELVLVFNPGASDGYDAYDSEKMMTTSANMPQIYTVVDGVQLSIDGMNNVASANGLPLVFSTGEANRFTIRASEIRNIDPFIKFVLVDNQLQTSYDLTTGGGYAFSTIGAVTTASRFTLLVENKSGVPTALSQPSILPDAQIYVDENKQIVVAKSGLNVNDKIVVVNSLGQIVASEGLIQSIIALTKRLIPGVYVVTATVGSRQYTKKVVIR
jgi:hypothetical protein